MSVDSKGRFGSFLLLEQISSGETSELYLAVSDEEGKERRGVALKRLKQHSSSDSEYREAFLKSGQVAAQLEHPQICRVLECGAMEAQPFIAREYSPGKDLRNLLRRHAIQRRLIPQPIVLSLVIRISSALAHAHPRIVHGCLTPQDILIGFGGEVHLINFGMGGYWAEHAALQRVAPKEKSAYFSPEHLNRGEIDHRADIFSLGVLLYEMLTGKQLFSQGLDKERVAALGEQPISPPSDVRPSVDVALDRIVMRALALDPEGRYQEVEELASELRAACAGESEMSEAEKDLGALMTRTFANEYRLEKEREALLLAPSGASATPRSEDKARAAVRPPTLEVAPAQDRRGGAGIWIGMGAVVALGALGALLYLQGASIPEERRRPAPGGVMIQPEATERAPQRRETVKPPGAAEHAPLGAAARVVIPRKNEEQPADGKSESAPLTEVALGGGATTEAAASGRRRTVRRGDVNQRPRRSWRHKGTRKQKSRAEKPAIKLAARLQTPDPREDPAGLSRPSVPPAVPTPRREEREQNEQPTPKSKEQKPAAAAQVKRAAQPEQLNWGFFRIISPVLVDVEVDGWRSAVSSGSLKLKLRVGRHKIRVIFRESGKEFTTNVTIKPNKTTKLKLVHG